MLDRILTALITVTFSIGVFGAEPGPTKIEIEKLDDSYRLLRDGEPFFIKGVGLEYGDIRLLAAHGGNAIRNWSTKNAQEVLDTAFANGVMVALGLPVAPERLGFDYNDEQEVSLQKELVRGEILKYRNHPALLAWIIGNELNFDYTNSKVYEAVNDIAVMIHELDPNHPATTTVAGLGMDVVEDLKILAPDLDILSFQVYGELFNVPDFLKKADLNRPVWITEWGAIGYWEMPETEWKAPIEMTSTEKADVYMGGYSKNIKPHLDVIIGSFAFLWGQKQERTPTWFGMFTEAGEETQVVDNMHYIWNGEWPENRSPEIRSFTLDARTAHDGVILSPGRKVSARVRLRDRDKDKLHIAWELKPESRALEVGGDREVRIGNLPLEIVSENNGRLEFIVPEVRGDFRLYVYAYDGNNHAAHANIPFRVR